MDLALLYVYGLVLVIGVCLFILTGILGFWILKIANIDKKRSREYLKNITYAIVGGIIAVILLELRGDNWKTPIFYLITMPISIGLIFLFILIGFWYLHLIDKLFDFLERLEKDKKSGKPYKFKLLDNIMKKKILFTIWIVFLALIGVLISWQLANQFSLIADEKYIGMIITTAVFLAGFGLLSMTQEDTTKNSLFMVISPNVKSIILWSMASIIFSFCYLIFSSSVWAITFFKLSAGFLFFTITLIVLLVFYHDNKYLKEIEKPKSLT